MRSDDDFREFFRSELLSELRRFERQRKEALAAGRMLLHPLLLLALAAASWWLWHPAPLAAAPALAGARVWRRWSQVRTRFKEEVVRRVIAFCAPGLLYHPGAHVGMQRVRESGLFPGHATRATGSDLVTGRVGETDVTFSELRITQGQGRRRRMVFSGLFFVADFHKSFRGRTLVLPDRTEWLLGGLGRAFQLLGPFSGARLVQLENPVFERHFTVYASDPLETRYLLTPALMERLVAFRERTGAGFRVAFFDECIYLALPLPARIFAVSPLRSLVDEEAARTWISELAFALGIVEDLDLNTRIWSKGAGAASV